MFILWNESLWKLPEEKQFSSPKDHWRVNPSIFSILFLFNGSDNEKITYLKTIIYEYKVKFKQLKINNENKHKKELTDISEDLSISTKYSPIHKTNIFGRNTNKIIIIDDMERSGLITDIKGGREALKEIRIFSNGKKITRVDNQYILL